MKKCFKYSLLFFFIFFFVSCATTKKETLIVNDSAYYKALYEREINSLINSLKEKDKTIEIYKDSLIYTKALKEKSQNFGLSYSFLETSYSFSIAEIDSNGNLKHTLENKDSIPTLQKEINVEKIRERDSISQSQNIQEKSDSTNINTQNSVTDIQTKVVKKNNIKEILLFSFIGFIGGIVLTLYVKSKLKKK